LATIEVKEFSLLRPRLTVDVEDAKAVRWKLKGSTVAKVPILERVISELAEFSSPDAARPTMGPNNLSRSLIKDPIDCACLGIIIV
jgi:hypothetical protein